MCGRFSRFTGMDAIIAAYGVDVSNATPHRSYNIAPEQNVAVITRENPLILQDMEWGFIPFYAKDLGSTHKPINARDDSLNKSMYKYAIENRRCIIPSDGFYEWKRKGPIKQPYYIKDEEGDLLSFGGIYSRWKDPVLNTKHTTFAIITTSPNAMMQEIHDRMPLILQKNDINQWLDPRVGYESIKYLIEPYTGILITYPVSTFVNKPQNDNEKCITPINESDIGKEEGQGSLDDFF